MRPAANGLYIRRSHPLLQAFLCAVLAAALLAGCTATASHTVWGADFDDLGCRLSCGDADFPHDFTGKQVKGLSLNKSPTDAASCLAACCAEGPATCEVYQWVPTHTTCPHCGMPGCWLGKEGGQIVAGAAGIVSRGRGTAPPPPSPEPSPSPPPKPPSPKPTPSPSPPPGPPGAPYIVDDTPGMGLRWEGVGAIRYVPQKLRGGVQVVVFACGVHMVHVCLCRSAQLVAPVCSAGELCPLTACRWGREYGCFGLSSWCAPGCVCFLPVAEVQPPSF